MHGPLFAPGIQAKGMSPLAAGDILKSFAPTGLGFAWGVGYTPNLWLSDINGAFRDVEFTTDGAPTGRQFNTPWASSSERTWPTWRTRGSSARSTWAETTASTAWIRRAGTWSRRSPARSRGRTLPARPRLPARRRQLLHRRLERGHRLSHRRSFERAAGSGAGDLHAGGWRDLRPRLQPCSRCPLGGHQQPDRHHLRAEPADCTVLSTLAPPRPAGSRAAAWRWTRWATSG